MNSKDKRLIEQLSEEGQQKIIKEILRDIPDVADKCEDCAITHTPLKLLNKLKPKQPDESKKEKASDIFSKKKSAEQ